MQTVYKYLIDTERENIVEMPYGGKVLDVGMDYAGNWCIWALVEIENPLESRVFVACKTGEKIEGKLSYIGTVVMGMNSWHIFEKVGGFVEDC